jgi:hypothetical protein
VFVSSKWGNDMKNTFGVIIVLLTCLLILPCSKDVNGADWISYGKSNSLLLFYNAENITFQRHNINQVWTASIPESEEVRVRYIQNQRKAGLAMPENWGFLTSLYEINCKDKTSTLLESKVYNINDKVISTDTVKHPSPTHISPETMMGELYKNVCRKTEKRKGGED